MVFYCVLPSIFMTYMFRIPRRKVLPSTIFFGLYYRSLSTFLTRIWGCVLQHIWSHIVVLVAWYVTFPTSFLTCSFLVWNLCNNNNNAGLLLPDVFSSFRYGAPTHAGNSTDETQSGGRGLCPSCPVSYIFTFMHCSPLFLFP